MNSTTIPATRRIESVNSDYEPDVEESEAEAIMAAIHAGKSLGVLTRGTDGGEGDTALREVCLTEFADPGSGDTRYAVEVWNDRSKTTSDYVDISTAQTRYDEFAINLDLA